MKICIDAGHGGNDSGAVGPTELRESDVNLQLTQALTKELENLGIEVVPTRETDVYVELPTRCDIANNAVCDYFISVHCNAFDDPNAVGIETLYCSDAGLELAKPIQTALINFTDDVDRGTKYRTDLYVLNCTEMPAALVECGFISHPPTEEKLRTADYQRVIVDALVAAICEYLELAP